MTKLLPESPLVIRMAWPVWFARGGPWWDRAWWVYSRLVTRPLMWWYDREPKSAN
jgi:hypothetical protein